MATAPAASAADSPAPPPPAKSRGRRWLSVGAVLLAVAAAGWFLWDPVAALVHTERARSALAEHRDEDALAHLRRAVELAPADADAAFLLARATREVGRLTEVEPLLGRAARLGADPEDVRRERWLLDAQAGRLDGPDGALTHFSELLADNRGDVDAIFGAFVQGLCVTMRLEEAESLLNIWADVDPDDSEIALRRGLIALTRGQPSEAAESLERSLARLPDQPDAELLLAKAENNGGSPAAAADRLERLLASDPDNVAAWLELAAARWELGQSEPALAAYEEVLKRDPHDDAARRAAGEIALDLGRPEEALAAAGAVLAHWPRDFRSKLVEAKALQRLGRREESAAAFAAVKGIEAVREAIPGLVEDVRRDPADAALQFEVGRLLLEHENRAEGAAYLESALRMAPGDAEAHRLLGRFYDASGDPKAARAHRRLAARADRGAG